MSSATTTPKALRADAQRNRDAIVAAAKSVLAEAGADAPIDGVLRAAGVGRGTFYRHFPTRESLFVAVMEDQVEALQARADELLDEPVSWDGLADWLTRYERSASAYSGLSAQVAAGLADDESPVAQACAPMKRSFSRLLRRAQHTGLVRRDVTAHQLLMLISALPKDRGTRKTASAYLQVVLDGLRR